MHARMALLQLFRMHFLEPLLEPHLMHPLIRPPQSRPMRLAAHLLLPPLLLAALLSAGRAFGQVAYTGTIGKAPIEFVIYSDSCERAVYAYSKYRTPIDLYGHWRNDTLTYREYGANGTDTSAILRLAPFRRDLDTVNGTWRDFRTGHELPLSLRRQFQPILADTLQGIRQTLLYPLTAGDYVFHLGTYQTRESYYGSMIDTIFIRSRKSGALLQAIPVSNQLETFSSDLFSQALEVGDYNLDRHLDFSLFADRFANGNTSRDYYLFNPREKRFYETSFTETNLEFHEDGSITSTNDCCNRTESLSSSYKLRGNELIEMSREEVRQDPETHEEIERHCFHRRRIDAELKEIKCR